MMDKFNGDVGLWQEFWSQYETAIHSNDALCKRETFTYLKTYLTGTAAKAIAGLTLTDSNYDVAVDILESRFGRKDLIVNAHMSKLLNLTPVKKSSDVSALRQLYEDCQIRSLELLEVVSDTYGGMVCTILLQMMPEDMTLEYSHQRGRWKSYSASDMKLKKPSTTSAACTTHCQPDNTQLPFL